MHWRIGWPKRGVLDRMAIIGKKMRHERPLLYDLAQKIIGSTTTRYFFGQPRREVAKSLAFHDFGMLQMARKVLLLSSRPVWSPSPG